MSEKLKLTIVGAGSSYTPELLEELTNRKESLPVRDLTLYDIDENRLSIMAGFCERFAKKHGLALLIKKTTDLDRAVYGADFIDTQIRVGGNRQRILDEKIPLKYGLVGQETTGAGGMMKAFRTIPVMLEIARAVEKGCPGSWIINYTNPTGLITEAVTRETNAKIAGFCSGGIFPKMWANAALGVNERDVKYRYVGLNHMNFIYDITIAGQPITDEEFEKIAAANHDIDPALSKLLGVLVSPYLQYYYHSAKRVEKQKNAKQTRGEYVLSLEKEIFAAYADTDNADKPPALAKRGGGGYSEVAMDFVNAVYNNTDTEMIVNVPNSGVIDFLPDHAVVEVNCLVNKAGVKPIKAMNIPDFCKGLIAAVKNYETLAVEAAITGDISKMKLALLAHPLVREFEIVECLAPELLEANRHYLPQFREWC